MAPVLPESRDGALKKNLNGAFWMADLLMDRPIYPPNEKKPCFTDRFYVGEACISLEEFFRFSSTLWHDDVSDIG
jgi:hypothetical protein